MSASDRTQCWVFRLVFLQLVAVAQGRAVGQTHAGLRPLLAIDAANGVDAAKIGAVVQTGPVDRALIAVGHARGPRQRRAEIRTIHEAHARNGALVAALEAIERSLGLSPCAPAGQHQRKNSES